jgi:isochorismate hydrolase
MSQHENANLNMLSSDNAVVLLVDHQVGLISGVRDIPLGDLKHNVVALAKAARTLGVPVIVTATMPDGMWGPTMPELTAALPGVAVISRTMINAWEDQNVRAAIEETGRKQIIVAGVSLEICASFRRCRPRPLATTPVWYWMPPAPSMKPSARQACNACWVPAFR